MLIYHKIFLDAHSELGLDKIPKGWCIHHINGNHYDNTPDNLQLMTRSDHAVLHHIGGKNHMYGKRHTEESRRKMSNALMGNTNNLDSKYSEESKKKLSESHKGLISGNKGHKHTEETKKKISDAHKGKKYHLGKKCSEESRKRMSDARKGMTSTFLGKHHTEESKRKLSESHMGKIPSMKGKHFSEEVKQRMSKPPSFLGKNHTEEAKKRMSESKIGINKSDETKQKISAAKKGNSFGRRVNQDMIDDVVMGIAKKDFCAKHNVSHRIYYTIKQTQIRCNGSITVQDYLETGYKT